MYEWRKLSEQQRLQVLSSRRKNIRPWHLPPHFDSEGSCCFHLTAACYEHRSLIGVSPVRMAEYESRLIELFSQENCELYAWCILPNHWHALVRTADMRGLIKEIGRLHGRMSFAWNGQDNARGRKCWHGCADRRIRSSRHFICGKKLYSS